jgi:hypothetical protein
MTHTVVVAKDFPSAATRPAGRAALDRVLETLRDFDTITLDFDGVVITPSFADELVGGLITSLGADAFQQRVSIENVSDSAKPLVRHITNLKLKEMRGN